MNRVSWPIKALLVGVLSILASACTAEANEVTSIVDPPASSTTAALVENDESTQDSEPPASPEKTAQRVALDQVVSWMNGTPFLEDEYSARFAPAFASQAPYPNIRDLFSTFASVGPWSVGELNSEGTYNLEANVVRDEGESLVVALGVESSDPSVISLLFFQPESISSFVPSTTQAEVEQRLGEAGVFRFLVADVSTGTCDALSSARPDEPAPIGSIFKLYVLGAVIDAVTAGSVSWDDEVEIRDELDSLPSGITQDDAPGSTMTVQDLAARMIQISDNTATDHLIELVSREAVETALVDYGHSTPELNVPFLTTREIFILKLGQTEAERSVFIESDVEGRRQILTDEIALLDLPSLSDAGSWTSPRDINEIEWFASPNDLCRAYLRLAEDPTALEVMTDQTYTGQLSYVGNKGGSEPGVLAQSWFGQLDEDKARVVVALVSNSRSELRADTQLLLLELRDLALTS